MFHTQNTFHRLFGRLRYVFQAACILLITLFSSAAFALPTGEDSGNNMDIHTIWIVGDRTMIEAALNACVRFFGDGQMWSMLKVAALLMLIMMLITVVTKRNMQSFNYFVMFVVMMCAFNIKTYVIVATYFDAKGGSGYGPVNHGQKIEDVPIGVAYPLMIFSKFSKVFAEKYDTEMQPLPELGKGFDGTINVKEGGMMIYGTEGFFSPLKTIISLRWRFNSPRNQLILKNLQENASICNWKDEYSKYADSLGTLAAISNPNQPAVANAKVYFSDTEMYQASCATAGRIIGLMMIQNVLTQPHKENWQFSSVGEDIAKRRVASSKAGTEQNTAQTFVEATQKEIDLLPNMVAGAMNGKQINRQDATEYTKISTEIERVKKLLMENDSNTQPRTNNNLVNDQLWDEITGFKPTAWAQKSEAISQITASTLQAEILFGNVIEKCASTEGDIACYQAVSLMTEARTHANIDSAGEAGMFQHYGPLAMNVLLFIYVVMTPIIAVVIMAKGIYGWKLVGSYLVFAVWVNSWLPLTMAISYYTQQSYTNKLAEVLSLIHASGMKGAVYSPTMINAVLDGASDAIATASVFMATVPMLMFAILTGSAYGFVHLAQRAAMTGKDFVDESKIAPTAMQDANLGVNEAIRTMSMAGPQTGTTAEELNPYFVSNMGRNDPVKIHYDSSTGLSDKYSHMLEDNQARSEILKEGNMLSADESTSQAVSDGISYAVDKSGGVSAKAVRTGENAHSVSNDGSVSIYAGADGTVKVGTPGVLKAATGLSAEASASAGIRGEESWNTSSTVQVRDSNGIERDMRVGEQFRDDLTYKINGQYVEGSKFTQAHEQAVSQTQSERHAIMSEMSHSQNASTSFDLDKQQFNNIHSGEFVMAKENAANAIMSMTDRNPQLTSVANEIMRARSTEEVATIAQSLAQTDMLASAKMTEGYFTGQNDNIAQRAGAVANAIEQGEQNIANKVTQQVHSDIDASQIERNFANELQDANIVKAKFENSDLHKNTVGKIHAGEEHLNQARQAFAQQTQQNIAELDKKTDTTAAGLMAKDIAADAKDGAKAIQEKFESGDKLGAVADAAKLATPGGMASTAGGTSSLFRPPESSVDNFAGLSEPMTTSSVVHDSTQQSVQSNSQPEPQQATPKESVQPKQAETVEKPVEKPLSGNTNSERQVERQDDTPTANNPNSQEPARKPFWESGDSNALNNAQDAQQTQAAMADNHADGQAGKSADTGNTGEEKGEENAQTAADIPEQTAPQNAPRFEVPEYLRQPELQPSEKIEPKQADTAEQVDKSVIEQANNEENELQNQADKAEQVAKQNAQAENERLKEQARDEENELQNQADKAEQVAKQNAQAENERLKQQARAEENEEQNQADNAHSTTKCDSFENDLTRRDDSQDLGQNARDLSRDIAVDEKLNPQTSAWLGSNYEEYKKLDEQGLVDKPNVGLTGNHQADNQPQETAIPAENQVSGSLNGEKHSEVADKDAHKELQNEQEKPAKPHKTRRDEHLSQENHHQNQGNHKKTQPTTPKSDTINSVSGSVNKLPTDHLPKGVNRVSVKEIYSTKLCNDPKIETMKMAEVAAQSVPCGANNPYKYGSTPYWVWEWAGHSNNLQGAFDLAQNEKMCQWSDEKTAAEHYIFARLLQNDPTSPEWKKIAHGLGLPLETVGYSTIKAVDHSLAWGVKQINKSTGSSFNYKATTSKPSFLQIGYELKGWTDGWSDNFNQDIKMEFGVCIPPKKGKK